MHMIHNEQTTKDIQEMLSSAPPEQSIPEVVLQLNTMVEESFNKQGGVEDEVKVAGGLYAVSDLAELGNAAGLWDQQLNENDIISIFEKTASKYIEKGLADGTIDPIQLQRDTEPLLPPEVREKATLIQKELGLPDEPTANMGIDRLVQDKTKPLQAENQELKSLLSQQRQQAAPGGEEENVQ